MIRVTLPPTSGFHAPNLRRINKKSVFQLNLQAKSRGLSPATTETWSILAANAAMKRNSRVCVFHAGKSGTRYPWSSSSLSHENTVARQLTTKMNLPGSLFKNGE